MKVAILGSRGIPNNYGGFEEFAEHLSVGLVEMGFDVTVYNTHDHPYQGSTYQGVKIIHCVDAEHKWGTFGQFLYDLNCIVDARKHRFDIILQLGYTSSSVWGRYLPKKSIITTNMDGLEWKRQKYSPLIRLFLRYAEKLAVKTSDFLIADSQGIKDYLDKKYRVKSTMITYGANVVTTTNADTLAKYGLKPYAYNMLIARMEPENSIEIILDGAAAAKNKMPILVIGNYSNKFGLYLKEKYKAYDTIIFMGSMFDKSDLNNLRYYSDLYFHGHTVGGTNPSLLEAMGSHALICAHNNVFNRSILGDDAFYFLTAADVANYIDTVQKKDYALYIENNITKIKETYNWDRVVRLYAKHFDEIGSN